MVVGRLLSTARTPAFTFIMGMSEIRWKDRKMINAVDVHDVTEVHLRALTVTEVR